MAEKKKAGKQESRGILTQFHASGLTQRQFAEQEGVPLSTVDADGKVVYVESE